VRGNTNDTTTTTNGSPIGDTPRTVESATGSARTTHEGHDDLAARQRTHLGPHLGGRLPRLPKPVSHALDHVEEWLQGCRTQLRATEPAGERTDR
jgi:hypothetical protein